VSLEGTPRRGSQRAWGVDQPTSSDRSRALHVDWRDSPDATTRRGLVPLARHHLPVVVTLLRELFPDNPLSCLGSSFVRQLLLSFVELPGGCGYVYLEDGVVAGFVVGSTNSRGHRYALLRRRWFALLWQTMRSVLVSPSRIRPLAQYLLSYVANGRSTGPRRDQFRSALPAASLVFLGVAPEYRRSGIATALVEAFLRRMSECGANGVKLAVASNNHGAVRFYLRQGWQVAGCYPSPMGGMAYRLVYDLRDR